MIALEKSDYSYQELFSLNQVYYWNKIKSILTFNTYTAAPSGNPVSNARNVSSFGGMAAFSCPLSEKSH